MHPYYLTRIITLLSVIAIVFFSYIPFLYLFSTVRIEKNLIFSILITIIAILIIFVYALRLLRQELKFRREYINALFLYFFFAIYALGSYYFIGQKTNDTFTLRTIVLVNPVFILLSFFCLPNKKDFIKILYVLSGLYFIFFIFSYMLGNISFSNTSFQNIFTNLEGSFYQNINTYLGIFVICNLRFLYSKNKIISIISKILITLSILSMFFIGGRGSVVALIIVLFVFFFRIPVKWTFTFPHILKSLILIFVLLTVIIFSFTEIVKMFDASVTWRRFMILMEEDDSSRRFFLYSQALQLYFSNIKTIFFGAGINSFYAYAGMGYPHNIILELLSEYGIVGTILFIITGIYIIIIRVNKLGSILGNSIDENIVFFLFLFYFIRYLFSGGLNSSWVFIFYMFFLLPNMVVISDKKLTDRSLVHQEMSNGK